eukprot:8004159-Alexandrium_andersonii.AAC.1
MATGGPVPCGVRGQRPGALSSTADRTPPDGSGAWLRAGRRREATADSVLVRVQLSVFVAEAH